MAATLGGVHIPSSIVWSDRYQYSPVAQSAARTLGGKTVVYNSILHYGRPITLTSLEDQGCVFLPVVKQLQALSDVPGAVYDLVIGDDNYKVMFRHEEPPAFEAAPAVIERSVALDGDLFRVTIKLITV